MQQQKPESIDAAKQELDQVEAWLAQFEQMQTNHANIEKRQAYLEGFLAQPTADPSTNGSGELEAVEQN